MRNVFSEASVCGEDGFPKLPAEMTTPSYSQPKLSAVSRLQTDASNGHDRVSASDDRS